MVGERKDGGIGGRLEGRVICGVWDGWANEMWGSVGDGGWGSAGAGDRVGEVGGRAWIVELIGRWYPCAWVGRCGISESLTVVVVHTSHDTYNASLHPVDFHLATCGYSCAAHSHSFALSRAS